jgi:reactive chlorine resistance protein C
MRFLLFTWLDTRGAEKMQSRFSTSFDPGQHLSVQAVSTLLGIVEIAIAVMIAMRPVATKISALGRALAVLMFLTTLSFLFSLPGWEPTLGGFPVLSGSGGFLLKDLVLLAAAVSSLGEALRQAQ